MHKPIFVLVSAAVPSEIKPIVALLANTERKLVGGRSILLCNLKRLRLGLLATGPGAVNTAQALTAAIEWQRPDLVVQTGCAGAFAEYGLNMGDIAIATEEIDVQLGVESVAGDHVVDPLPFAVLRTKNTAVRNRYPIGTKLVDLTHCIVRGAEDLQGCQVARGPFISVSTITATPSSAAKLYAHYRACAEQMEGAAAAHVALHYGISFLEIRAVSNYVGHRDKSTWQLDLAFERAGLATYHLLNNLPSEMIKPVA